MVKVFDREEFVEDEDTELNIWFKDFNSNEQRETFIQNKEDPF